MGEKYGRREMMMRLLEDHRPQKVYGEAEDQLAYLQQPNNQHQ
jgi:hypothetical protein